MTDAEQNALIADMVRERRDLMAKIKCIDVALYRAAENLNRARFATDKARAEDYEAAQEGMNYPPPEKLQGLITDLRTTKERLAMINQALDT